MSDYRPQLWVAVDKMAATNTDIDELIQMLSVVEGQIFALAG